MKNQVHGYPRPRPRIRARAWAVLLGLILCQPSCLPPGQRLLSIQIERDGALVFDGYRGVRDTTPINQMWSVLQHVPFQLVDESTKTSEDARGQTCSLNGEVVVRVNHVDDNLLRASLKSLSMRKDKGAEHWHLDGSEAARIKKASQR